MFGHYRGGQSKIEVFGVVVCDGWFDVFSLSDCSPCAILFYVDFKYALAIRFPMTVDDSSPAIVSLFMLTDASDLLLTRSDWFKSSPSHKHYGGGGELFSLAFYSSSRHILVYGEQHREIGTIQFSNRIFPLFFE